LTYGTAQADLWRTILTRAVPIVYGMFIRRRINPAFAEELTQKTVFDAVKGRSAYDPTKGTHEQWIFGIAHKNLAMEMRRRATQARMKLSLADYLRTIETHPIPDEALEKAETAKLVRLAMDSLEESHRQVLTMKYLQDLSARGIAESMKITEKAAHSLLYRARIDLRNELIRLEPLLGKEPKS